MGSGGEVTFLLALVDVEALETFPVLARVQRRCRAHLHAGNRVFFRDRQIRVCLGTGRIQFVGGHSSDVT